MQAGAAVANATNKAAGLSASTPEPGTIISAIQLVNGGRTIGPAALAHFTESVRNKLLSLLVNMEPIQDLHGYSHPWPAGGGKNKLSYPYAFSSTVKNSCTITVDSDGVCTFDGTPTDSVIAFIKLRTATTGDASLFLEEGNYIVNGCPTGGGSTTYRLTVIDSNGSGVASDQGIGASFTVPSGGGYYGVQLFVASGYNPQSLVIRPMIRLASVSDATFSPYSNICPITGRTGLDVYVGPTSAIGDATAYSMDWTTPAGTVYAGSADIVTGDLKPAPEYSSYNGETLVGPWISSMDAYDPEGTPTTGAQVVDLGGTMTEYHITGQDIITLVGDNYIWSDSGDVIITE